MDWDTFYLGMAEYTAKKSKDPSTKVGCVIVRPDRTVASLGYNGFPRGMFDWDIYYDDRNEKLARTIHAEENAILNARENVKGYTAYVTHPPCVHCTCVLIQAGIDAVIFNRPTEEMVERWGKDFEKSRRYFAEAKIVVVEVG